MTGNNSRDKSVCVHVHLCHAVTPRCSFTGSARDGSILPCDTLYSLLNSAQENVLMSERFDVNESIYDKELQRANDFHSPWCGVALRGKLLLPYSVSVQ